MATGVAERFVSLSQLRLERIERQLLLEAARAASVPGTIILPPLLPSGQGVPGEATIATGEATRRAARGLVRLGLIELTEPELRIGRRVVEDTVTRLLQAQRRSSWPAGFPETEDAAARFLRLALKPAGVPLAEEAIRLRSLGSELYVAGHDPRYFVARAQELRAQVLKQVRPDLRLRNMRRTERGDEVVATYREELEAALSGDVSGRGRWSDVKYFKTARRPLR